VLLPPALEKVKALLQSGVRVTRVPIEMGACRQQAQPAGPVEPLSAPRKHMARCAALGGELHYEHITANPTTAKNVSPALDIVGVHVDETILELSRRSDRRAHP